MDPDVTLALIRAAHERGDKAARSGKARNYEDAAEAYGEAAELFAALDQWMCNGGFAPWAWQKGSRG